MIWIFDNGTGKRVVGVLKSWRNLFEKLNKRVATVTLEYIVYVRHNTFNGQPTCYDEAAD